MAIQEHIIAAAEIALTELREHCEIEEGSRQEEYDKMDRRIGVLNRNAEMAAEAYETEIRELREELASATAAADDAATLISDLRIALAAERIAGEGYRLDLRAAADAAAHAGLALARECKAATDARADAAIHRNMLEAHDII